MKKYTILISVLIVSLFLSTWELTGAEQDPMAAFGAVKFNEGTLAPDFSMENLAGDQVNLADFRGKVVLLNFWATW
jgi:cytochrome oxidase Cu insertion factor (SCO1/SenC/PrrC family)